MTAFDLVAILVALVSALIGYARGAVREIVTLVAFALAAVLAILALPYASPALRHVVHPDWAAAAAAVVIVFVLVYVVVRVCGGWVARKLHAVNLGGPDRILGAAFGVLRALVALGLFFLVYQVAMPAEFSPKWVTGALTWPVARASGHALESLAPGGARLRDGMGKLMSEDVKSSFNVGDNVTSQDEQAPGVEFGGGNDTSRQNAETPDEGAPPPRQGDRERHRGLQVKVTGEHGRRHHAAEAAP